MPTVVDTISTLYAFCPDGACPGYVTREVEGISRETQITFFDQGSPNMPGVSHSTLHYIVPSGELDPSGAVIPADLRCEHCDRELHISPTDRPVYSRMNPQDPMELVNRTKRDKEANATMVDAANARADVSELRAQIIELRAALEAKQQRNRSSKKTTDDPDEAA